MPRSAEVCASNGPFQMEEEGVPSTALREVSLLQMLSESIYVVRRGSFALRIAAFLNSEGPVGGKGLRGEPFLALQAAERRARRGGWQGDALPGASARPLGSLGSSSASRQPALAPQVFEFLDTDLKKFMDLTGRGPANPLPKSLVQVR